MVDEKKRQEIEKQAEEILKKFSESLKKVKIDNVKKGKREVGGFRKEGIIEKCDEDFRERMFANAPNKEGDSIVVEKKSW